MWELLVLQEERTMQTSADLVFYITAWDIILPHLPLFRLQVSISDDFIYQLATKLSVFLPVVSWQCLAVLGPNWKEMRLSSIIHPGT